MTKTIEVHSGCDRSVSVGRGYFLARFFGVALGADGCGSGGVASIVRSRSSVRRNASLRGNNSIALSSAACCAADGFGLFMVESNHV
jgi:hypothetical protein